MPSTLDVASASSPAAATAAAERRGLATWELFLLLTAGTLLLTWVTNEFVMTREAYHALFDERLEPSRVEYYFEMMAGLTTWGYVAAPLLLLVRVAFVAFLFQTVFLFFLIEPPYAKLFRAASLAWIAQLYGSSVHTAGLLLLGPANLTLATVKTNPMSLAHLLEPSQLRTPLYVLLDFINPVEAVWMLLMYLGLRSAVELPPRKVGLTVGSVWLLIIVLKWAVMSFVGAVGG